MLAWIKSVSGESTSPAAGRLNLSHNLYKEQNKTAKSKKSNKKKPEKKRKYG
jgi:hypothetical protein